MCARARAGARCIEHFYSRPFYSSPFSLKRAFASIFTAMLQTQSRGVVCNGDFGAAVLNFRRGFRITLRRASRLHSADEQNVYFAGVAAIALCSYASDASMHSGSCRQNSCFVTA